MKALSRKTFALAIATVVVVSCASSGAPGAAPAAAPASPAVGAPGTVFDQLVKRSEQELQAKAGKLVVALELTDAEANPILDAFRAEYPFVRETKFERIRTTEQMSRLLTESAAGRPLPYDIVHVSFENWTEFDKAGMFLRPPYPYKDVLATLPKDWPAADARAVDPEGMYIATTGLARGIAWNTNLIAKGQEPKSWQDCLDPKYRGKVMYDPRPKLTALQHDPKTRDAFLTWLRGLVLNAPVYQRGQSEGLEKLASGEYPLFCGVNFYSATRPIDKGAPIAFAFPDPFPLEFGTQIHIMKGSATPATTQLFIVWLATKGQPLVEKFAGRGMPWNPEARKFPLAQGKYIAICDVACLAKSPEYDKEHAKILGITGP